VGNLEMERQERAALGLSLLSTKQINWNWLNSIS